MPRLSPSTRKALYGVGAAVVALAVAYGLIAKEVSALWLTLVGALLNAYALSNVDHVVAETPDTPAPKPTEAVAGPAAQEAGIAREGAPVQVAPAEADCTPAPEVDTPATAHEASRPARTIASDDPDAPEVVEESFETPIAPGEEVVTAHFDDPVTPGDEPVTVIFDDPHSPGAAVRDARGRFARDADRDGRADAVGGEF